MASDVEETKAAWALLDEWLKTHPAQDHQWFIVQDEAVDGPYESINTAHEHTAGPKQSYIFQAVPEETPEQNLMSL